MRPWTFTSAALIALASCDQREYWGPAPQFEFAGGGFGFSTPSVGDVDGDGAADMLVCIRSRDYHDNEDDDELAIVSPRTGQVLTRIDPIVGAAARGLTASSAGDLDGDGRPDVAIGAPGRSVDGRASVGAVTVMSGATGAVIRELRGELENERFGTAVLAIRDVDGDSVDELAVSSPGWKGHSFVRVFSTPDSNVRVVVEGPQREQEIEAGTPLIDDPQFKAMADRYELFGADLVACGDVDADGHEDFAVRRDEEWLVYSTTDGQLLSTVTGPDVRIVDWIGDWDGDGARDILRQRSVHDSHGFDQSEYWRVEVVSARSGNVLFGVGLAAIFTSGWRCGDIDGDGADDIAIPLGRRIGIYGSASFR